MAGNLSLLHFNFEISEQYFASSAVRIEQHLEIFICTLLKNPEANQTKPNKKNPKHLCIYG